MRENKNNSQINECCHAGEVLGLSDFIAFHLLIFLVTSNKRQRYTRHEGLNRGGVGGGGVSVTLTFDG